MSRLSHSIILALICSVISTIHADLTNDTFTYYDGDIVIGTLLPITRTGYSDMESCLQLDLSGGFQALTTLLYTLDFINRNEIFPKKLGALVYNSFMDVDNGVKKSVSFIEKFLKHDKSSGSVKEKIAVVLIGGNNGITARVNNLLKLFYLPVVSFWSSSPELTSKRRNENFVRTIPSDENSVSILVDILYSQNWTYINIFRDSSLYSSRLYTLFKTMAKKKYQQEICTSNEILIDEFDLEFNQQISQLKTEKRVRVNVVLASDTKVYDLIGHVKESDSLRVDYVWIGLTNLLSNVAAYNHEISKIKPFLNTTAILPFLYPPVKPIISHILSGEGFKMNPWLPIYYKLRCGCSPSFLVNSYDCLNATLPLAACDYQKYVTCKKRIEKDFLLHSQSPYMIQAVEAITYTIMTLNDTASIYDGLLGNIFQFDENNNDGPAKYSVISNCKSKSFVTIGYAEMKEDSSMEFKYLNEGHRMLSSSVPNSTCSDECLPGSSILLDHGTSCCWRCGPCSRSKYARPKTDVSSKDRRITEAECVFCDPGRQTDDHISCYDVQLEYQSINRPFSMILLVLACLGFVILGIIILIFAINWNTPIIKATGREMMVFLFIGIALCFISSAIIVCFPPSKHLCNFATVIPSFCLTLCYGTLFAKILRILKVFQLTSDSKRVLRKFIDPTSQVSFILTMLFIQIIVLFIIVFYFETNPALILTTKDESYKHTENSKDILIAYPDIEQVKRTVVYGLPFNKLVCIERITMPLFATLIFPTILIFVTAYYSFKARKVPDGFNETRALLFVNYAVCLFYIFMPVAVYFLQGTIYDITPISTLLQINGYATMFGIFSPKVYIILVTPEKNTKTTVMFRTKNSIVSIKDFSRNSPFYMPPNDQPPNESEQSPVLDLSYSLDSNVFYPIEEVISKRKSWEVQHDGETDLCHDYRVTIYKHKEEAVQDDDDNTI